MSNLGVLIESNYRDAADFVTQVTESPKNQPLEEWIKTLGGFIASSPTVKPTYADIL